ncbi:unnamed protein product [Phytomonas sp. Hart1]|nr:unnamed protein product [Phytomonas sp. Hart1]|eukprot:CCW67778.1 unnamed protein product [Phytomonas sp. isolate Hart1]
MKHDVRWNDRAHEESEVLIPNPAQPGLNFAPSLENHNCSQARPRKGQPNSMSLGIYLSITLAGVYVITSMIYYFTIRYSKLNYIYSGVSLVTMTEAVKMAISIALKYCVDGEFIPIRLLFSNDKVELWKRGLPYAVPAFLYAVYNNMTFNNLDNFDLATYQVFMQTRIWFTGIMFTLILGRALSLRKWMALIFLACGVALKYFSPTTIEMGSWVCIVIVQAFISSFSGVYNEYMFKSDPGFSIHMQNFFMYLYGILFNFIFGVLSVPDFYHEVLIGIGQTRIFILLVLIGATTGISASFILKFIDVIVKALASAVEVPLTAILAAVLLGESLYKQDILAAIIVMFAIYMYYTKGIGDSRLIHFTFRRHKRLNTGSQEMEKV